MRYTLPLLFALSLSCLLNAQQASQYSLYMLNEHAFNPAYAGLDNSLSITGVFRKQWVNLEGSPTQQQVNMHMPLYILRGGFGINIENDALGAERNTSATLSYNYWLPINKKNILALGLGGGIVQKSLDGTKLRARDGEYGNGAPINHNDNSIPINRVTAMTPTAHFGVYLQNPTFEVGFSAMNLLGSSFSMQDNGVTDIELSRSYFFTFNYNLEVGRSWSVHPSLLVKSDIVQTQVEISTLLRYNDNIFGGASFRGYNETTIDAVALIGGLKLNERVTLAYSYDLTLSGLNAVGNGSHEIMLNYNLNKPIGAGVPPKIIFNPRFL